MHLLRRLLPWLLTSVVCACGAPADESAEHHASDADEDLPLGDRDGLDMKADDWGAALTCKNIPTVAALADPAITLSVDGLTLHLVDRAGDYDRVFPIGVGQVDGEAGSLTSGESHSMWPLLKYGKQDFSIKTTDSWSFESCRVWWTDPDTDEELPVFAGLPFMRWSGSYAIHGPITNYNLPSGGNLKRGYVSHGCVRMEAADVVEVYGRIRGVSQVPVHVQREAERYADGDRVDVDAPWIGAECSDSAACNFTGGFCKTNPLTGTGYCTRACTQYCPDRPYSPKTFCVADPDAPSQGICAIKESSENFGCRPYDHLTPRTKNRKGSLTVKARVCLPGSRGRIGDRCASNSDCGAPNKCAEGICTQSCSSYCPDQVATPKTFCAAEPLLGGPSCLRQCTPASNGSECPSGTTCAARARASQPSVVRHVCVPE